MADIIGRVAIRHYGDFQVLRNIDILDIKCPTLVRKSTRNLRFWNNPHPCFFFLLSCFLVGALNDPFWSPPSSAFAQWKEDPRVVAAEKSSAAK